MPKSPKIKEQNRRSLARRKESDPELVLRGNLKAKYGITLEQFQTMERQQQGLCLICRQACKSGTRLCVDHNHETGHVRGLLCRSCNMSLGGFKDDILLLESAIRYLLGSIEIEVESQEIVSSSEEVPNE